MQRDIKKLSCLSNQWPEPGKNTLENFLKLIKSERTKALKLINGTKPDPSANFKSLLNLELTEIKAALKLNATEIVDTGNPNARVSELETLLKLLQKMNKNMLLNSLQLN